MKKRRLKPSLHLPVLIGVLFIYALAVGTMWSIPHRWEPNAFGRMNAHQGYASLGYFATFGALDRTLVDWYMHGSTLEENIPHCDRFVWHSTLIWTGPFIAWCFLIALIVGTWRSTRG